MVDEAENSVEDAEVIEDIQEEIENEEISNQDEQVNEYVDRLKRTMAEFDNFRKRTEKEKAQMYTIGAKDVLEKILPIVDNFERALAGITPEEKEKGFAQGIEMIYKQFITVLKEANVEPITAVGEVFDPNLHNAVMHIEDDNFEENTIVEEFQKGYLYKGAVLRHSMVKVAN
jgi:molecular chaperone GrpE